MCCFTVLSVANKRKDSVTPRASRVSETRPGRKPRSETRSQQKRTDDVSYPAPTSGICAMLAFVKETAEQISSACQMKVGRMLSLPHILRHGATVDLRMNSAIPDTTAHTDDTSQNKIKKQSWQTGNQIQGPGRFFYTCSGLRTEPEPSCKMIREHLGVP